MKRVTIIGRTSEFKGCYTLIGEGKNKLWKFDNVEVQQRE